MKIASAVCVLALLAAAAASSPLAAQGTLTGFTPPPPNMAACATQFGLNFVCGVRAPEDEMLIPGTRWIITSGKLPGEGVKLVDSDAKTETWMYSGAAAQIKPDKKLYPNCLGPLDPKSFIAHGLYVRAAKTAGLYNLYVVMHGVRETIEVFIVDTRGAQPGLTWTGCIPMPAGDTKANGVAAYSDGTVLVTLEERPGTNITQELAGELVGDVLEWKPGSDGFHVIPGTQLAGDNGIEISQDESEFYVVAYGARSVSVFSRKDPSKVLRSSVAPNFTPDNIRWSGSRLLGAGPTFDEPYCGGTPAMARLNPNPPKGRCNRGFVVAELNPATMAWNLVDYGEPRSEITGVSTGLIVGGNIWISANFAEGLAWRPVPGSQPAAAPAR